MNTQDYYHLILNSDISKVFEDIENEVGIWKEESAREAVREFWNTNYTLILKSPEKNRKMQEETFYFAYYNAHHDDIRIIKIKDYVVMQERKIITLEEIIEEKEVLEKAYATTKNKRQLQSINEILNACEKINIKVDLDENLKEKQNVIKPKI